MSLRFHMIKRGKTASEIAAECGISKQRFYFIERRGISCTSEAIARKIARSLDANLFDICGASVIKFKPKTEEERQALIKSIQEIEL